MRFTTRLLLNKMYAKLWTWKNVLILTSVLWQVFVKLFLEQWKRCMQSYPSVPLLKQNLVLSLCLQICTKICASSSKHDSTQLPISSVHMAEKSSWSAIPRFCVEGLPKILYFGFFNLFGGKLTKNKKSWSIVARTCLFGQNC